jgi:hypothetical protein
MLQQSRYIGTSGTKLRGKQITRITSLPEAALEMFRKDCKNKVHPDLSLTNFLCS